MELLQVWIFRLLKFDDNHKQITLLHEFWWYAFVKYMQNSYIFKNSDYKIRDYV